MGAEGLTNATNGDNVRIEGGILFSLAQIWKQMTSTEDEVAQDPIMITGKQYLLIKEAEHEITNKISLTYRFGFEPIPKSENGPNPISFLKSVIFSKNMLYNGQFGEIIDTNNFTSDVGWGCMIRTSQSLLANTYLRILNDATKVINLFDKSSTSPFSLHNFIKVAKELPLKVQPGEWFGPNAASLSISRLCDKNDDKQIKVMISENGDLYEDSIKRNFERYDNLLILFPVRLGIEKINSYYWKSLFHFLSCKQSVGIAGGKPLSSFYFVGYSNQDLYYLDPHFSQKWQEEIDYSSYHLKSYQKLHISNLDPSMMIGILLQSFDDYTDFQKNCTENGNIVVHFHNNVKKEVKRRNSGYVNIRQEVANDDFIDVKYEKYEKTGDEDDFVDINEEVENGRDKEVDNGRGKEEDVNGSEVVVDRPHGIDESFEAISGTDGGKERKKEEVEEAEEEVVHVKSDMSQESYESISNDIKQ